ncbi:MAG TPA: VOC family protein [Kiloniellales bacterium]|nr:VOC family protein [Kiloniellales bacterium]
MAVTNALAGVAVRRLPQAVAWYRRLLDRKPDTQPMEGLAEWAFPDGGWIQLFEDAGRAGRSSVTLMESDLDARLADLDRKGIAVESCSSSEQVRVAIVRDPDGNLVVFAQPLG